MKLLIFSIYAFSYLVYAENLEHRGFKLELGNLILSPQEEMLIKNQIDLITEAPLSTQVLEELKTIPVYIKSRQELRSENLRGAQYSTKERAVFIAANNHGFEKSSPILLHELLHGWHQQFLNNGFQNKKVRKFFEDAQNKNCYKTRTHFMENDKEFFAVAGTIVLVGNVKQPPHNIVPILACQPEYIEWLKNKLVR